MKISEEPSTSITSWVNGVSFTITPSLLCKILYLPVDEEEEDICIDYRQKTFDIDDFSLVEDCKSIFDNENIDIKNLPYASALSSEMRVLHHIVNHIFLPQLGKFGEVTHFQIFIMWCIINKIRLNPGRLFLSHMIYTQPKHYHCLPYGMYLTQVFKHFHVNLSDEIAIPFRFSSLYNESTVKRMHMVKENGVWITKLPVTTTTQASTSVAAATPTPQTHDPSQTTPPTTSHPVSTDVTPPIPSTPPAASASAPPPSADLSEILSLMRTMAAQQASLAAQQTAALQAQQEFQVNVEERLADMDKTMFSMHHQMTAIKDENKNIKMEIGLAVQSRATLTAKIKQYMVHLAKVNHDFAGYCRQEVENYTKESLNSLFEKAQAFWLKLQDPVKEKMLQLKTEASKDQAAFMAAMEQYLTKEARSKDPEVEIIEPPAPTPSVPTPVAPKPASPSDTPPANIPPISAVPLSTVPPPDAPKAARKPAAPPAAATPSAQGSTSTMKKKDTKGKGTKKNPPLDPQIEATFSFLKAQERKEGRSEYNKQRYQENK
ncbi:hypothetical protein U1Q18_036686, partial [Sarracenia purpurea var. burkii]